MWRGRHPTRPLTADGVIPDPSQDVVGLHGGSKHAQDRASCRLRRFVGTRNIVVVTVMLSVSLD